MNATQNESSRNVQSSDIVQHKYRICLSEFIGRWTWRFTRPVIYVKWSL